MIVELKKVLMTIKRVLQALTISFCRLPTHGQKLLTYYVLAFYFENLSTPLGLCTQHVYIVLGNFPML